MTNYRLVVIRPSEPPQSRKKVLKAGISKEEAQAEEKSWASIFNDEVFMEPVPILRVELDDVEPQV